MIYRHVRPAALVMTLVASFGVSPATAQDAQAPQRRGDQGLFQGGPGNERGDVLFLTASAYESYDDNIVGEQTLGVATPDPTFQSSGLYSGGDATLFYGRRSDRVRFGANAGASLQYYPRLDDLTQTSYHTGADLSVVRGRRTFLASQSASWLPFFVLGSVPVVTPNPVIIDPGSVFTPPLAGNQDLAVFSEGSSSYQTGLGFTQGIGRRSSFTLNYGLSVSDLSGGLADLTDHSARATLNVPVSRYVSLRAGYGYQDSKYDTTEGLKQNVNQEVNAGVQYQRALSATRSIAFGVGTGVSVLRREEENHPELGVRRHNQALGSANFTYVFHRTWRAGAEYRRALQLLQGVSQPFFSNDVSANLVGRLSRRVDVVGSVGYSQGAIAVDSLTRDHDTRAGSVRLRYALTSRMAVTGEYAYYSYNFSRQVVLPQGVVGKLDRQVVRVGLVVGVPLLRGRAARP
ncbi:MAG TPA: hypothetical protein VJM31_08240 [Vicinamibacterales bacterium]|nr:hypothetical protein [Vicinamibacterales bacterium]